MEEQKRTPEEIEKDVALIEKEKQEYLGKHPEEDCGEVDILEFDLNEEEIEDLIDKLIKLKETKEPVILEVDEENEIIINYGEDSEDE